MLSIDDTKGNQKILFEIKPSKHKFEYQELCEELEPIYGKLVWTLPHKPNFTEYKIRKAHEIAKSRNILKINYLIGIIKKLL